RTTHGRGGVTASHAATDGRRYRCRDDQHLPLRDLPAHPGRDPSRGKGGVMERRDFLHVSGTLTAGLVIGFRIPDRRGSVPFAPNAWLQVGTDDVVTLTVDKSEMGEGNHTALAMLIAEELDADWTKVKIGPVPENPAGWSRRMSTGGSTSVRTSWDILRKAGATARAMLVASIERSPVFGGKVKSFDATGAKAMPGVRHVVQLESTPWMGTGAWGVGTASGVAVVADTYWQAVEGRRALQITWDEGPNASLGDIPAKLAALARGRALRPARMATPPP